VIGVTSTKLIEPTIHNTPSSTTTNNERRNNSDVTEGINTPECLSTAACQDQQSERRLHIADLHPTRMSYGVVWCQRHSAQTVYFIFQRSIACSCSLWVGRHIRSNKGRPVRCPARIGIGTDPIPAVVMYTADLIGLLRHTGCGRISMMIGSCRPCDTASGRII